MKQGDLLRVVAIDEIDGEIVLRNSKGGRFIVVKEVEK